MAANKISNRRPSNGGDQPRGANGRWLCHGYTWRIGYEQRDTKGHGETVWGAQSAPTASSSLRSLVGYNTNTTFTDDLLQRKVPIPPDVDTITAELIEEICCIWARSRLSHGPVDIIPSICKYYSEWGQWSNILGSLWYSLWALEDFCLSSKLIQLICKQLNLVTRCGAPPSRWKNGLQVLLEKVPGIALVDKLCAILLMERDFNFYNKLIFWHVAMNKLWNRICHWRSI